MGVGIAVGSGVGMGVDIAVGSGVGTGVETGVGVGLTVGSATAVAAGIVLESAVAVGPGSFEQAPSNAAARPSSPHSRANRSSFEGQDLFGTVYQDEMEDIGPCIADHHLGTHGIIASSCSSN